MNVMKIGIVPMQKGEPMSKDTIYRQAAIDVMLMAIDDDWEPDYATDRMNELPSTEPERKKGKWIDMSDGGRIKTLWAEKYKCDKCGMYGTRAWKFCPYCGADMRGEEK